MGPSEATLGDAVKLIYVHAALMWVGFGLAVIAWVLVIRTERVIRSVSPIFSSDSTAVKVFPLLISVMIAFAGLQVVRYWTMGSRQQS
ncbi:MAG: hypothetical protein Q8L35_01370 [Actinomycetota bacterium]|nr:hypothetical protein [Actinomycetota bacterium]